MTEERTTPLRERMIEDMRSQSLQRLYRRHHIEISPHETLPDR